MSLSQTIQKILEINRKRKHIRYAPNQIEVSREINQELKVLNKLAEHQALLIRRYENQLASFDR